MGNTFTSLTITDCNLGGGNSLEWFNPAAGGAGAWQAVSPTPTFSSGPPPCVTATLNSTSSPTLAQLTGTVFGASLVVNPPAPTPMPTPTSTPTTGYSLVASDGGIFNFGNSVFYGSEGGTHLNAPIVGTASTPNGGGYWLVASDGGVFSFGNAAFYGSRAEHRSTSRSSASLPPLMVVGYWLVASDGGDLHLGDAAFYGSRAGPRSTSRSSGSLPPPTVRATGWWRPTVGSSPSVTQSSTARGRDPAQQAHRRHRRHSEWGLLAGGVRRRVFTFGNAAYSGSEGGTPLNKPIVGIAATPTGKGYWLVASDGGIFSFGDAAFYGSEGGTPLNKPIVGIG